MKRLHVSIDSIEQIPKSQIKSWNISAPACETCERDFLALSSWLTIIFPLIFARRCSLAETFLVNRLMH